MSQSFCFLDAVSYVSTCPGWWLPSRKLISSNRGCSLRTGGSSKRILPWNNSCNELIRYSLSLRSVWTVSRHWKRIFCFSFVSTLLSAPHSCCSNWWFLDRKALVWFCWMSLKRTIVSMKMFFISAPFDWIHRDFWLAESWCSLARFRNWTSICWTSSRIFFNVDKLWIKQEIRICVLGKIEAIALTSHCNVVGICRAPGRARPFVMDRLCHSLWDGRTWSLYVWERGVLEKYWSNMKRLPFCELLESLAWRSSITKRSV